jgi:endoglucanase
LGKRKIMSHQFLKEAFVELMTIDAPYGFEDPMITHFKKSLKPYVDKIFDTPRGNVVGVQKGSDPNALKIALAAHMDHIGFTVFNIEPRGFIRFRKVGGVTNRAIQGQQVRISTKNGKIKGVVGVKPGHITLPSEANMVPPIQEMYIDVGAWSKEEVEEMGVRIGSPIVFNAEPLELANNLIASPAVDDKVGLIVLIMLAKNLKDVEIPATVYYIGNIEEEGGFRGAQVALYDIDVDAAIAIDTAPSGWQPDVNMRDIIYEVGKGPAIHIGEMGRRGTWIYHAKLREWLTITAENLDENYQSAFQLGGTDASAMAQTRGGIPAITVGIPRRYSHSPVETFSLDDMAGLIRILESAIRGIKAGYSLLRS